MSDLPDVGPVVGHPMARTPRPDRVAQPGPTLAAPIHDSGQGLPAVDDTVAAALEAGRQLFRVARHPRADAAWPRVRAHLIVARARLLTVLADDPDDAIAGVLLVEADRMLGDRR